MHWQYFTCIAKTSKTLKTCFQCWKFLAKSCLTSGQVAINLEFEIALNKSYLPWVEGWTAIPTLRFDQHRPSSTSPHVSLYLHQLDRQHHITLDNVKIMDRDSNLFEREVSKAIHHVPQTGSQPEHVCEKYARPSEIVFSVKKTDCIYVYQVKNCDYA